MLAAIGVSAIFAVAAYMPRAVSWRSDVERDWRSRCRKAHAGLNSRVQVLLLELHKVIEDELGGEGDFDPLSITIASGPIVERAVKCASLLRLRDRIGSAFEWYRRLGWPQPYIASMFIVADFFWILFDLGIGVPHWVGRWGIYLMGLALSATVVIFIAHLVLHGRLTQADVVSKKGDSWID